MLKQATTVAAASLIAVFMSGCASMPDVYKGAPKGKVCKPGDTYEECCEKRELQKPLKYRFGGACERNGGDNDRGGHNTPDRGGETPGNDNPGTDTPGGQPDSEGPSNEGRGNTGHDHGNGGGQTDGGQTGGGQTGGGQAGGGETDGGGKSDNDKGGDRDGGPGQGPGGRGDVGGRDHSALKVMRPAFA